MKKTIIGLFLLVSVLGYAGNDRFKFVEKKIELKYQQLKDNHNNKLVIDDVDVHVYNDTVYVTIEIESFLGDGEWKKFDKASYDRIAKSIANDVRNLIGTNQKVEITLILDKEFGKDEMLHSAIY